MPIRILALVFFWAVALAGAQGAQALPERSIVYSVHDPTAIKDYRTNPSVVHAMVNRGPEAATSLHIYAYRPDRHPDSIDRRFSPRHPA